MDHIKNSPNLQNAAASELRDTPAARTVDLDHPNAIGTFTPWQVDFRQLDPGRLKTQVTVRAGHAVLALNISMNQRVHQRGASPEGWTTLGIPGPGAIDSWKGNRMTKNTFLSFGDSDGFDGISTGGFAGGVVSFETARLRNLAQACGFDLSECTPDARAMASVSGMASLKRLQRRIAALLTDPKADWTGETEESLMLEALAMLTDSTAHDDKSHSETRRKALSRAIDLMLETLDEPLSIEEICLQCGASWRTLNRAFKEHFGHGPKTYYMRLRLNRVREDLLGSSFGGTITDAANRHGFWHMGQFARDYKLFFGDLPSETRRRLQ